MIVQTINRDEKSYRSGVVLGLTMAEIMLLLVFCLLIAAAGLFERDARRIAELTRQKEDAVRSASALSSLLAEVKKQAGSSEPVRDDWQKLAAATSIVEQLEKQGLSVEDAQRSSQLIAQAVKLSTQGAAQDDVVAAVELVKEVKTPADQGKGPLSVSEIKSRLGVASPTAKTSHDWPPIIRLSEASGYFFSRGQAELDPNFTTALSSSIIPELLNIVRDYKADVIEVIGHTDEQPINPRPSNLDRMLVPVLKGEEQVATLYPGDNAGLGLARATSVVRVLKADTRLASLAILPYSAAYLIKPDDHLSDGTGGDVKERRRIEIRVRRSDAPLEQPAREVQTKVAELSSGTDAVSPQPEAGPVPIIGQATVIDGDTIEIARKRVRLFGIDAPESAQLCANKTDGGPIQCGQRAAFWLSNFIARRHVTCTPEGMDRFKRVLAHCAVDGKDIGAAMVRAGWAQAFVRYSREYVAEEAIARNGRVGLWQLDFIPAWEWRALKSSSVQ